jgi:hypothetical protein
MKQELPILLSQWNPYILCRIHADSYTRHLFIGLHDIITASPSNEAILNASRRNELVKEAHRDFRVRLEAHYNGSSFSGDASRIPFPTVQYVCTNECYGRLMEIDGANRTFSKACSTCIRAAVADRVVLSDNGDDIDEEVVVVVGAGIHVLGLYKGEPSGALREFRSFLRLMSDVPLVLVTIPSYQRSKIPIQFRDAAVNRPSAHEQFYNGIVELSSAAEKYQPHLFSSHGGILPSVQDDGAPATVPLLDYYHLTRSCVFDNCTYDGGHRSRYVNRWKAQLFLNMVCEVVS